MHTLHFPDGRSLFLDAPRVMGVLNVTPDSFSDGGRFFEAEDAVARAVAMARAGAEVLDIGGESTRPGARRIDPKRQTQRVVPVIRAVRAALPQIAISIDTTRAAVALAAVEAGADLLNDVSAGREDPGMFALAAERGLPLVLMHMLGRPATMQRAPRYDDVVAEVKGFLVGRAAAAQEAGVAGDRIVIDPGIGFGKTRAHNVALLAHLETLVGAGYPVLVGASRKASIGALTPGGAGPDHRLGGTAAITALAVAAGVSMVRVHDVAENVQAAAVAAAITRARADPGPREPSEHSPQ